MKTRIALLGVLAIVAIVWFQRGAPMPIGNRLGAPAAALDTPYQSELAWAAGEIAADISEMARRGTSSGGATASSKTIVPWHPDLWAEYAAAQIGPRGDGTPNENDPSSQHEDLLPVSVDAILKSGIAASSALKRDMKNPHAHEAAALTLAAFAMRESAEGLSDTRWALNRMTAHLAMAHALRNGGPASVDGQLALGALLALTNRHKTALTALDAVTDPEAAAWQRALRIRVTKDWRLLADPANATHLEKLEYFRARRLSLRQARAGQDLEDLREPIGVDFGRIAIGRSFGVEDGNDFVMDGLTGEIDELAYVYKQMHQRELPKDQLPDDIVNARAGRLLSNGDPQVLPWGAWAEFANRHIGMWIVQVDLQYRHMQGAYERADALKVDLDKRLGHLTMYPVASAGRTKGQHGTEADLSQIDKAIDVAIRAPELVTWNYWVFLENGSNYEPVKRGMPKRKGWFAPGSADAPSYDLPLRSEFTVGSLKPADLEALMDEARHSNALLGRVAQRYRTNEQLTAKVRELSGPRVGYDTYAIDSALEAARDADDRIALHRQACELTPNECLELASELAAKDEAAAAAEYEKAFSNPALDRVAMSWATGWLVQYYERINQPQKATELAARAAGTGSAVGMFTLARLHERRSEIEQADDVYTRAAGHYPDAAPPLAAFLYRQAIVAKKPEYLDRWKASERELFPGGVQPMVTEMKGRPVNGVFVEKDSYWSRKAGLQAGDIIVGIDGLKVENVQQLDAVLWFKPEVKTYQFTAWRGVLLTVEIPTRHGMTLKTHPLKGWIE